MRKIILVSLLLSAAGCTRGPHVVEREVSHRTVDLRYACLYSDSVFVMDRTRAICDTAAECTKICAEVK